MLVAVKRAMMLEDNAGRTRSSDDRKVCKTVWIRLQHENIVPLLGYTTDCPFPLDGPTPIALISPWLSRGNFESVLKVNMLDADLLKLIRDVANGLVYCNVLIDDNGNACLTDFGLSFILPEFKDTPLWSSNIGHLNRWSPAELVPPIGEDAEGYVPQLTSRCDIYALGCLVLYGISGERPYHRSKETMVVINLHHRKHPPRPLNPRLNDEYWRLINRLWGMPGKPATRPTAEEVVKDILAF
ncbi:hypothetical protein HWV62_26342 [Athelia sp. TMB]|nr:hypothetical protein HWV62_26342 [Athelia sp. TMB]